MKVRNRQCDSPEPDVGGQQCVGRDMEMEKCDAEPPCPGWYDIVC